MRSRTVSRPWSPCRLTLSTPPISRAKASRRARSSSSGFQFIRILRADYFVVIDLRRSLDGKRLAFQPAREDIAVGAFEQAADRRRQFAHRQRRLAVQPFLVVH